MEEPKEFKVGDVVTSEYGVSVVESNDKDGAYPVKVWFGTSIYARYTYDGRDHKNAPISLFHGKGKVDITFTPNLEPVYEYQWLVDHGPDQLIITRWHRTEEEVLSTFRKFSNYPLVIVERLDKYKREVKS